MHCIVCSSMHLSSMHTAYTTAPESDLPTAHQWCAISTFVCLVFDTFPGLFTASVWAKQISAELTKQRLHSGQIDILPCQIFSNEIISNRISEHKILHPHERLGLYSLMDIKFMIKAPTGALFVVMHYQRFAIATFSMFTEPNATTAQQSFHISSTSSILHKATQMSFFCYQSDKEIRYRHHIIQSSGNQIVIISEKLKDVCKNWEE